MTFSILFKDEETGAIGGAAATGSYCVGGWVLRGRFGVGMSASQGTSPSPFWGEAVLDQMAMGQGAQAALEAAVNPDHGRAWRQLGVLDNLGATAHFTGSSNTQSYADFAFANGIALGNMLENDAIPRVLAERFLAAKGRLAERLISGLEAAEASGGDFRGLKSAALLIHYPDAPPLSLRIDMSDAPLADLRALYEATHSGDYYDWLPKVPNPSDPFRGPDDL